VWAVAETRHFLFDIRSLGTSCSGIPWLTRLEPGAERSIRRQKNGARGEKRGVWNFVGKRAHSKSKKKCKAPSHFVEPVTPACCGKAACHDRYKWAGISESILWSKPVPICPFACSTTRLVRMSGSGAAYACRNLTVDPTQCEVPGPILIPWN